ncbi:PAS domain S-box protein [Glaciecola sp. 1036]|uniref:PAS domain-containing sensor histidine kinase n=1 Tax=Alteromonadaceae TaxID=72275 RepID=UPI003D00DE61
MGDFWQQFFRGDYMPHGHCYLWQPGILWTNVISDFVIALAYFSIPIALVIFAKKRKGQSFNSVLWLFAAFILTCGITHVFSIYTIWNGTYGLHGISKAITAVVSAITAIVLFANLDKIIAIPTVAELKRAEREAIKEKIKSAELEIQAKANSIFKFSLELIPTGVLVIDKHQRIHIANRKLESIFEYSEDELTGKEVSILVESHNREDHRGLVNQYMKEGKSRDMANGRLVWGLTKTKRTIPVEISLSVHEVENETFTFASVTNVGDVGIQKKRFLETSRRMQRAIDATDVGIWEWNMLTNKIWFSPRSMELLATSKQNDELFIDDWFAHVHPDDRTLLDTALKYHLEQGEEYKLLYRGKNKNNEYKWLRVNGNTVFDEKGKPILMSGTLTDVDNIQRLQQELEHKNQFLDAVLDNSNSGIYILDINNIRLIFANKQVGELVGYSTSELNSIMRTHRLTQLIHPDDLDAFSTHKEHLNTNRENKVLAIEFRLKHKDGHYIWCYANTSVFTRGEDGLAKEVVGAIVDVTQLKQREDANIRLSQDFLDTFEQAAVGIAHVSSEGRWIRVNSRICEILGYDKDELMSKTFQDITHPDDLDTDVALVNKLLAGEMINYSMEKRYEHKKGHWVWARLTVAIVERDEREAPYDRYFISVIEDISQEKQLQEDLVRSNEELEQFAYVASHDLKEPLRTLRTYTSYLIQDLQANKVDRVKQDKEFIDSASERMTVLIDDLLKFSRVGSAIIEKQETDLSQVIADVIGDLETKIDETSANVNVEGDIPLIQTDPSQVRLVVQNLIHNALKFCAPEITPQIQITAEIKWRNWLLLHFKDNGIGIAPEYQQQIFGLFKRLHRREEYQGTGLGLAIVNKIMNRLDGKISVTSEKGQGTTFTLHFPLNK